MGDESEAFETWRREQAPKGPDASVIALYEMVARVRGVRAEDLPRAERHDLAMRALHAAIPGFHVTAGSDRSGDVIELAEYDPRWPRLFAEWKDALLGALGETAILIEHIGSTSVPGLAAKPVVDVQVSVAHPDHQMSYVPALEALGVQLRSGDEEHHFFRPPAGRPREVHVHVCEAASPWERRHVLFRDHLRAHARAREEYLAAKLDAARRWSDDPTAYTEAKGGVIRRLTAEAEAWAAETGWKITG